LNDAENRQIHMYAACFTLYALSTFFNATRLVAAFELANELFENICRRLCATDGGVFPEAYELDFDTELATEKNALGHLRGRRTVNTHIHLVEALTAYHAFIGRMDSDTARSKRSATALKLAADLVVNMKSGPRLLELRDAADARQAATNLRLDMGEKVSAAQVKGGG
jgi:hypothetical protein